MLICYFINLLTFHVLNYLPNRSVLKIKMKTRIQILYAKSLKEAKF